MCTNFLSVLVLALVLALVVLLILLNQHWTWVQAQVTYLWIDKSNVLEEVSLTRNHQGNSTSYGTIHIEHQCDRVSQKTHTKLYTASIISMVLLWIIQWLFWLGFIGLSLEEYVVIHHSGSISYYLLQISAPSALDSHSCLDRLLVGRRCRWVYLR